MKGRRATRTAIVAAWLLSVTALVCAPFALAADTGIQSSVDVYWRSTRMIAAPGVSTVVVLDDQIAHAESRLDAIEFAGISRGDTVALAYVNGTPVSIIVHVLERPVQMVAPSLRRESEMAHGMIGSDVQTTNSRSGSPISVLSSFSFSQQVGDNAMDVNTQVEDDTQFGGHSFNLRNGGASYRTPTVGVYLLDFAQSLTGASGEDHINNFSSASSVQLRGGALTLRSGKDDYALFAGSTIPYYFLTLNATRDVAGFTFHRKQTSKLSFFGGASYLNIPLNINNGIQRREYFMQNAGFAYRITRGFLLGAESGVSNDGMMGRVDASYSSYRLSGYGTAIYSSQTFPLNQLQSLFSGTSSYKGGASYRVTRRLTQSVFAEHTDITPGLIYRVRGSNDYLSPNLSYDISPTQRASFAYTYSRNTGGFTASTTTGNRYDAGLTSQFSAHVANNAQVTIGSVQDPLQISSQDQFTVRDSLSIPIKGQTVLFGVEHDRVQPSLIAKLNEEINLLSPALQAQFLANPSGFVDSTNFPPEVKALLTAEQPTGTTLSASSNLNIGPKLRFSPSVSVTHAANGPNANAWTQSFGYSLAYQLTSSLQFRSSLTNVLLWNTVQNSAQRTTVISAGFQKAFTTAPGALPLMHRSRVIEGRVFRDNNINGAFNAGEPGLPGIEVQLDGRERAITDEQGRYRFSGVSADQHHVSIDLMQFRQPVRMTTSGDIEADLIQQRLIAINFGILDFARVMGNIYNDLRFDNHRQPDSKGMQDIELELEDGKEIRKVQTAGSGDFEFDNVPPGDYRLSLDPASIPANYIMPLESVAVHVNPVSTVLKEIPLRALRSISGRVLLKVPDDLPTNSTKTLTKKGEASGPQSSPKDAEPVMIPVAGVQVTAGSTTATTDKDGTFLLRNLPAGDLNVSIKPVRSVPAGINLPAGTVKLPPEPVQIQGATIVVTNAELLPYLTDDILKAPTAGTQQVIASAYTHARERDKQQPPVAVVSSPALQPKAALPIKTEPALQRNEPSPSTRVAAAVPALAQPVKQQVTTPASVPPPVAVHSEEQKAISYDEINRAICESMPSLGEAAQCFNQLKRTKGTNPQK